MGARTVLPSAVRLNLYLHVSTKALRATSGRRTPRRAADGRTGGHPGGQRTGGGRYTTDGHTCSRYGGREDAEGAPTWRQGRCNTINVKTLQEDIRVQTEF
jgi:hypothetical protein